MRDITVAARKQVHREDLNRLVALNLEQVLRMYPCFVPRRPQSKEEDEQEDDDEYRHELSNDRVCAYPSQPTNPRWPQLALELLVLFHRWPHDAAFGLVSTTHRSALAS